MIAVGHGVGAGGSVCFALSPRGPYPAIKHAGAGGWVPGRCFIFSRRSRHDIKGLLPLPEVEKRSGGGLSGQGGGCRLGVNLYPGLKGLLPGIGIESGQGWGCPRFEKCPKFLRFFRDMLLGVLGYLAGARIDLRTLSQSTSAPSGSVSSK